MTKDVLQQARDNPASYPRMTDDVAGLVERLLDNAWGLNVADTLGKRDADRAEAAAALQSQAAQLAAKDAEIARLRGEIEAHQMALSWYESQDPEGGEWIRLRVTQALAQQGGDDGQ